MTEQFNIVEYIEKNPLLKLNKPYESKLIEKIKQKFTGNQQNLFVTSFYSYLNYNQTNDFVIDLREMWAWLGFSRIEECKRVLVKNFTENIDYKISTYKNIGANSVPQEGGEVNSPRQPAERNLERQHGGQNKEKILLNIYTFKKLCIKSNTKKADEVHDYFIKLEEALFETMTEETNELRMELIQTSKETAVKIRSKEDKIIDQFPEDNMCIYIADIGIHDKEQIIKYGCTNNLKSRISTHRRNFENFELISAYSVINQYKFERMLKEHPEVKYRTRKVGQSTELLMVNKDFTVENLDTLVKTLIKTHCTIESLEQETRQLEIKEKTKQMELEIRKMELELELKKLDVNQNQPIVSTYISPVVTKIIPSELVDKFMTECTKFSDKRDDHIFIETLFENFESWFRNLNKCKPNPVSKIIFSKSLSQNQNYKTNRISVGQRVGNTRPRKLAIIYRELL
jgi:hypothetical protein